MYTSALDGKREVDSLVHVSRHSKKNKRVGMYIDLISAKAKLPLSVFFYPVMLNNCATPRRGSLKSRENQNIYSLITFLKTGPSVVSDFRMYKPGANSPVA